MPDDKITRKAVLKLLFSNEKQGLHREAGLCCLRLARLFRQIGPSRKSALYGRKAVEHFRQTDDKPELIRALRAACVPFEVEINQTEYLREALTLAREIGAKAEEAHTIYRFTRAFTPSLDQLKELDKVDRKKMSAKFCARYAEMKAEFQGGHTIEEALAVFEEIHDPAGTAMCLISLGIERKPSERALFDRAENLYRQAGESTMAERTKMMADVFAPVA